MNQAVPRPLQVQVKIDPVTKSVAIHFSEQLSSFGASPHEMIKLAYAITVNAVKVLGLNKKPVETDLPKAPT